MSSAVDALVSLTGGSTYGPGSPATGLTPSTAAGDEIKFLRGDATWASPPYPETMGATAVAVAASLADALTVGGEATDDQVDITVPVAAGGDGNTFSIITKSFGGGSWAGTAPTANQILYSGTSSPAVRKANLILAINGTADTTKATGGSNWSTSTGISGITATDTGTNTITITSDTVGSDGNSITLTLKVDTSSGAPLMSSAVDTAVNLTNGVTAGPGSPATGLTPATAAGDESKFLRGDATWQTITSSSSTKADLDLDHLFTLVGANADTDEHLGTFTGSTIADNQTLKVALQSLETSVEGKSD